MTEEEEFELIPMSPLRRLEKRLDKIESGKGVDVKDFLSQFMEIVKMNQQLVDELAKANDALRIEIARLPAKLDELIDNTSELVSFIKAAGSAPPPEPEGGGVDTEDLDPLLKKMDSLIDINKKIVESNEAMMSTMDQMTMKMRKMRPRPPGVIGRSLPPTRPPILQKKKQ